MQQKLEASEEKSASVIVLQIWLLTLKLTEICFSETFCMHRLMAETYMCAD